MASYLGDRQNQTNDRKLSDSFDPAVFQKMTQKYECAWMVLSHLDRLVEIDPSWTRDEYLEVLRKRDVVGRVLHTPMGQVLGFRIERFPKRGQYDLIHIAIDPDLRRRGLGTILIQDFLRKAKNTHREKVLTVVQESNLPALLFLKANGFVAKKVLREHFGSEDGILMRAKLEEN